jgi:hypothetical protein
LQAAFLKKAAFLFYCMPKPRRVAAVVVIWVIEEVKKTGIHSLFLFCCRIFRRSPLSTAFLTLNFITEKENLFFGSRFIFGSNNIAKLAQQK